MTQKFLMSHLTRSIRLSQKFLKNRLIHQIRLSQKFLKIHSTLKNR
jgi:hypothetical protein